MAFACVLTQASSCAYRVVAGRNRFPPTSSRCSVADHATLTRTDGPTLGNRPPPPPHGRGRTPGFGSTIPRHLPVPLSRGVSQGQMGPIRSNPTQNNDDFGGPFSGPQPSTGPSYRQILGPPGAWTMAFRRVGYISSATFMGISSICVE